MKEHCSKCQKVVKEVVPGTGIKLDNGKIFCWDCSLKACEKALEKVRRNVFRGTKF